MVPAFDKKNWSSITLGMLFRVVQSPKDTNGNFICAMINVIRITRNGFQEGEVADELLDLLIVFLF